MGLPGLSLAKGPSVTPGPGTGILKAAQCRPKKKNEKKSSRPER